MSQSKTWLANKGTTTRVAADGSPKQGAGASKRLYVGNYSGYIYRSYLAFALDWPADGQIVSAILTLSTDDGLGPLLGNTMPITDSPLVYVRRLTSAFGEGTNSATFVAADYTVPASTSSNMKTAHVSGGALDATNIDITDLVEEWAPKAVLRRSGKVGGAATQYGLYLYSSASTANNAGFISEEPEAGDAAFKPYITLVYELGHTAPDAPTNLSPSGSVASIGSFQGNFSDPRPTDTLRYSEVQVINPSAAKTGTGTVADDRINVAGHGYSNGQQVWFTSLTGGTGINTVSPFYVRNKTTDTFQVSAAPTSGIENITVAYSALSVVAPMYAVKQAESDTAIVNGRFDHVPSDFHVVRNQTYQWRARVYDNEGQVSAWTALTSFSVSNTDPNAPTPKPVNASSYASLDGIQFSGGTFSDPDSGDTLLAYEVQLSAYASGDAHWLDDEFILWNTGKRYVTSGSTSWSTPYGGASLAAGTYYWRSRVWDNNQGISSWAYASIVLTADFVSVVESSTNAIQLRPRAPWRIVIRNMLDSSGVRYADRRPGQVVAVLEDAMNVGASLLYNSPGEAHWTLGVFHPQLSVIEPRQTHYAIEFRQGDGWREVFAGLVWDFDATNSDIVFYGVDYLGLLDSLVDEQYKSSNSEADYTKGGSKYSSQTIGLIVWDQLNRAIGLSNSPVKFIAHGQSSAVLAAMLTETITVYSTYAPTLNFITGLLDSHRAGYGKRTRLSVQKTTGGTYQFVVTDDPGVARDNLRLRYGELVQGFRVVPFGKGWGTRVAAIGRDKDGIKVRYNSQAAPGIDEAVWGRFMIPQLMDGVSDDNDLARRARQFIVGASMLGKQMGLALRSGVLQPRDGYDLMDKFPVDIQFGSVDTTQLGHDGYWAAVGITWQAKVKGESNVTLTLQPTESGSAPSSNLLVTAPISKQAEWQIGYKAPNPLTANSKYWLDQTTGKVYQRVDGSLIAVSVTVDV